MRVLLMHEDRDFDLDAELPWNTQALVQDLELTTLFDAMADGDEFLFEIARRALLLNAKDTEEILYRQRVLQDCLEQPDLVRQLYDLSVEAIEGRKRAFGFFLRDAPSTILSGSVSVLDFFLGMLRRLRGFADEHAGSFRSPGFVRLFALLEQELDDGFLQTLEEQLKELRFRRGILMSAELGSGGKGIRYVVRRPRVRSWAERLPFGSRSPSHSFTIPDRDESGFRALDDLRAKGVNLVADALARSTDHILGFFVLLRAELAFYIGCLNLRESLVALGRPSCFPCPAEPGGPELAAQGLYDPCLALLAAGHVVGNDLQADGKPLVMITGANQGGKSTFLRSVGLAHLMLQSGMFVAAESFVSAVCDGLFTHFKREEDASMEGGKLDEELRRMSDIADAITPGSILLCNESFSSTNEREGSEIARQIVRALLEQRIRVLFVTHLFDLADGIHRQQLDSALFLRAERQLGGRRTFRLVEGEPFPTSYGEDTFRRVFGAPSRSAAAVGT